MKKISYLYQDNLLQDITVLVQRNIPFEIEFKEKGCHQLSVNDEHKNIVSEFSLQVHMPFSNSMIGWQIYANESTYYHLKNEIVTCPKFAVALLTKAKNKHPEKPWHYMIIRNGDIENPTTINKTQVPPRSNDNAMLCAKYLWSILGDIPINDNDEIKETFLHFKKGDDRFAVYHWFENKFNLSIARDLVV